MPVQDQVNEEEKEQDGEEWVVIHVFDKAKTQATDFFLPKRTVVNNMLNFRDMIKSQEDTGRELLQISIRCKLDTFTWIQRYLFDPRS